MSTFQKIVSIILYAGNCSKMVIMVHVYVRVFTDVVFLYSRFTHD